MKIHIFLVFILFKSYYLSDNFIIGVFYTSQAYSVERILNGDYIDKTSVVISLNNERIDFNQTVVFPRAALSVKMRI